VLVASTVLYDKEKKYKVKDCLDTLNRKLPKKHKFTLDANAKNSEYYRENSEQYGKHKVLMKHYAENPSLKNFIEKIQSRDIKIGGEEDW
jgi:hypothetical protein